MLMQLLFCISCCSHGELEKCAVSDSETGFENYSINDEAVILYLAKVVVQWQHIIITLDTCLKIRNSKPVLSAVLQPYLPTFLRPEDVTCSRFSLRGRKPSTRSVVWLSHSQGGRQGSLRRVPGLRRKEGKAWPFCLRPTDRGSLRPFSNRTSETPPHASETEQASKGPRAVPGPGAAPTAGGKDLRGCLQGDPGHYERKFCVTGRYRTD